MAKRRWTLMLIPHGEGTSRSVAVSSSVLKIVGGVAVVLAATFLAGLFAMLSTSLDLARTERLRRENAALVRELAVLGDRVEELSDTLAVISRRDEHVRLVAGLEPLDPDVRRAGIGGPAGPWADRERLLAEGGAPGREALRVHANLDALVRRANLLSSSFREAADSLRSHVQRLSATPSIMPTEGFLTSNFSRVRYHPILHYERPHEGLDITAPYGTPIIAPGAGRVTRVGWENGYGLAVEIDHGYGVVTRYAHLSRTAVAAGQVVKRGDRLGFVGSTGLSTGPHLHYEVIVDGRPTDPLRFIMPDAIAD
jgi:murein DD-endopeptidase MepM/ murein hydrolase activator NlpD